MKIPTKDTWLDFELQAIAGHYLVITDEEIKAKAKNLGVPKLVINDSANRISLPYYKNNIRKVEWIILTEMKK